MASYISSNANRFYTALESTFGAVGSITAANRIPAVKLAIRQQLDGGTRRDKTGSRTFGGVPAGVRRKTDFDLQTYLTSWNKTAAAPGYGPLFQSALGAAPQNFGGGTVAGATADGRLGFSGAHGLSAGQGVTSGGEVRFVAAVVDANTVQLNAAFSTLPLAGSVLGATVTYQPATDAPSVSLFDFWSPDTAVQRILQGAAVDQLEIAINGDFHQFRFTGLAKDLLDSASFSGPVGQLQDFPPEPEIDAIRLHDRARAPGTGLAGSLADEVLHDHGRERGGEESTGGAVEGVRVVRAEGVRSGSARGDGVIRFVQHGQRLNEGTVPGGTAGLADQRDVPVGPSGKPGGGCVSEERGAGGAGVRRQRQPAAVAIPGVAGAGDD